MSSQRLIIELREGQLTNIRLSKAPYLPRTIEQLDQANLLISRKSLSNGFISSIASVDSAEGSVSPANNSRRSFGTAQSNEGSHPQFDSPLERQRLVDHQHLHGGQWL